jgi:hypothetical protein
LILYSSFVFLSAQDLPNCCGCFCWLEIFFTAADFYYSHRVLSSNQGTIIFLVDCFSTRLYFSDLCGGSASGPTNQTTRASRCWTRSRNDIFGANHIYKYICMLEKNVFIWHYKMWRHCVTSHVKRCMYRCKWASVINSLIGLILICVLL